MDTILLVVTIVSVVTAVIALAAASRDRHAPAVFCPNREKATLRRDGFLGRASNSCNDPKVSPFSTSARMLVGFRARGGMRS